MQMQKDFTSAQKIRLSEILKGENPLISVYTFDSQDKFVKFSVEKFKKLEFEKLEFLKNLKLKDLSLLVSSKTGTVQLGCENMKDLKNAFELVQKFLKNQK